MVDVEKIIARAMLFFACLFCGSALAMPAADILFDVVQPDGGTFKARNVGNETYNYKVTADGYAVVRDPLGYYSYADNDGNSSGVYVHDVSARTESELEFLQALDAGAVRQLMDSRRERRTYQNFVVDSSIYATAFVSNDAKVSDDAETLDGTKVSDDANTVPAPLKMPAVSSNLNSGEKRALVVLVQFQDVKFSEDDPADFYNRYLNEEGFGDNNSMGSVHDYFVKNSGSKFIPVFDVVGPVTISGRDYADYGEYSSYGTAGARVALAEALDSLVVEGNTDFSVYDNDGDKYLDFVHMIYAGYGSNDGGADSAIWPHMWYMSASNGARHKVAFRTYVDKYACSQELDGLYHSYNPDKFTQVGVGTFIHEFSHLLGLGDHYSSDADAYTLGTWDVMDAGAYNCRANPKGPIGCSPPYYSAFERMSLGWLTPTDLAEGGSVTLFPLEDNEAFRVRNPKNSDEFFLLEYRDSTDWDGSLPNHGMLIWHIDYDATTWSNAAINTGTEQHVDIEEADGVASTTTMKADVFPGTGMSKVRSFNQFITWDNTDLEVSLTNIYEDADRDYVWFTVNGDFVYIEPESSSSEAVVYSSESIGCSGIDCDETDFEISSSSVEEVAVSSAEVAVESSSDAWVTSSAEVSVESSAEAVAESSSGMSIESSAEATVASSETLAESSASEETVVAGSSDSGYSDLHNRWDEIFNSDAIRGDNSILQSTSRNYFVRIFSLNGNVLYEGVVQGMPDKSLVARFGKMPLVMQVFEETKLIYGGRIQ